MCMREFDLVLYIPICCLFVYCSLVIVYFDERREREREWKIDGGANVICEFLGHEGGDLCIRV